LGLEGEKYNVRDAWCVSAVLVVWSFLACNLRVRVPWITD
jgi:hypothetical protein